MRFTFTDCCLSLYGTEWLISGGLNHFDIWSGVGLSSGLFQEVCIFLVLSAPDLDAVWWQWSSREESPPFTCWLFLLMHLRTKLAATLPRIQLVFWATGAHCQLVPKFPSMRIPLSFSLLVCRAALNEFFTQSVLMSGIWKHTQVFGAMESFAVEKCLGKSNFKTIFVVMVMEVLFNAGLLTARDHFGIHRILMTACAFVSSHPCY